MTYTTFMRWLGGRLSHLLEVNSVDGEIPHALESSLFTIQMLCYTYEALYAVQLLLCVATSMYLGHFDARFLLNLVPVLLTQMMVRWLRSSKRISLPRRAEISAFILCVGSWIMTVFQVYFTGGRHSPLISNLLLPTIGAAFLLGPTVGSYFLLADVVLLWLPLCCGDVQIEENVFLQVGHPWYLLSTRMMTCLTLLTVWIFVHVLERRNFKQNQLLVEATTKAQKLAIARGDFIARMSHELKNPFQAISGVLTLLSESDLDPQQREMLTCVNQASDSFIELLSSVLDHANPTSCDMHITPIKRTAFFKQMAAQFKAITFSTPVELIMVTGDTVPAYFWSNRGCLTHVVSNIVHNAIKFSSTGQKVYLVIGMVKEQLENGFDGIEPVLDSVTPATVSHLFNSLAHNSNDDAYFLQSGDFPHAVLPQNVDLDTRQSQILRIEVSDFGCGVAPKDRQLIFDEYFQIEEFATREHTGSGLGLTIVKEKVMELHGRVGVCDNTEGDSGTRFVIDIPIHEAQEHECDEYIGNWNTECASVSDMRETLRKRSKTPLSFPLKLSRPLRAMVVDDVRVNCHIVQSMLKSLGCEVAVAQSGEDAIAALNLHLQEDNMFDVILMDYQMPSMSGPECIIEIREILTAANVPTSPPFIFGLTASSTLEVREQFREAGADVFLSKPISTEVLRKQLEAFYTWE